MNVRVRFYAQLRDATGKDEVDVILPDRSNVGNLLEQLYKDIPSLRLHDKGILVGAGLEFVDRKYVIQAGDEISVMPPVQGG
jgi:molybdopterin converting factor small subunit